MTEKLDKNEELKVHQVAIDSVQPAEYNPRALSQKKFEDIKDSLNKFGFVDPVIVNKNPERENILVGGHQRVKVAKELGYEKIPAVFVSLNLDEEKELNVRLNKNQGDWDFTALKDNFSEDSLIDWGFAEKELSQQWSEIEDISNTAEGISNEVNEKKYPIVPKYNERYSTFMIFCNNELDVHWMKNFLGLTKSRIDYKSNAVAPSFVITAEQFQEIVLNDNKPPVEDDNNKEITEQDISDEN
jgi:ParB/RepB/Spo0J family partition protein